MKSSIGSESHVFVREAMKAWRASSGGAAGTGSRGGRKDAFVVGPDDAPNIQQHHDAVSSADTDRIRFVAGIALSSDRQR
jgi:hypothetical protein